jgi:quercetin dioxygenase-like cupin family protein
MSHKIVQPAEMDGAPDLKEGLASSQMGVVRLEIKKGALTETHCHDTECLLIVLQGVWRVHLRNRAVTVRENEMLHIPPRHEHFAEALTDSVALSISVSAREWTGCGPFLREDPDPYLWGV